LSAVDLSGLVYDLTFDQARNSLWYAFMQSGHATLYRYDIASGKTSQWALPPTDYNGYLDRVGVAPDGSVWLTEEYSIVRVDPVSGSVLAKTFPVADPDAVPAPGDPGNYPLAFTFDSAGKALVSLHNVKSLVRLDASLAEVGSVRLPAGMVGPGDLVDVNGVIYAAPYRSSGPGVLLSEQGLVIGWTTQPVIRFAVYGQEVAALASGGLSRVGTDGTIIPWQPGVGGYGGRLALTDGGAAVYSPNVGAIEWVSPGGGVEGRLQIPVFPDPGGFRPGPSNSYVQDQVWALAADDIGSVWYVNMPWGSSVQLVHIKL
jgi:hypothetical protein